MRVAIAKNTKSLTAKGVPVVAVANGIRHPLPLPNGQDWVGDLYTQVFQCISSEAAVPFFLGTRSVAPIKDITEPQLKKALLVATATQTDRKQLRIVLTKHMNKDEIETICFDMSIDFEKLSGLNKEAKIRELILLCEREERLQELFENCREMRPNIKW